MGGSEDAKIERLLSRNVDTVIDKNHLRAALRSGKKLRVKLGIDPTSSDLHLGHAVVLAKLREFQDLGHQAVLIIGDFTALVGDPSGRDKTRPQLTPAEVTGNMKKYLRQAGKIIDLKKSEVLHNSAWLGKLRGEEFLKILGLVSVQKLTEREDFRKRLSEHTSLRMHELIYPILQGYDSVATKTDVELGGTDQLLNLIVGRDLMEKFEMKSQDVLTVSLLVGTDGERKMSKSLGNYIGLEDEPNDMFGKVMSLPDKLILNYFETLTDFPRETIQEKVKADPKSAKEMLALEIVKRYHGAAAAETSRERFEKVFSRHEMPDDAPVLKLKSKKLSALDIVVASRAVKSKGEARRLIEQGGFEFNEKNIKNPLEVIAVRGGENVRIGKKRFFRAAVAE